MIFSSFLHEHRMLYVAVTRLNRLTEAVLMSDRNKCFIDEFTAILSKPAHETSLLWIPTVKIALHQKPNGSEFDAAVF